VLQNRNKAMLMHAVLVLGQSRFKRKVWKHPKLVLIYLWARKTVALRPFCLNTAVFSVSQFI
jgi:hypothetical protein